jgi:hypothetical protein
MYLHEVLDLWFEKTLRLQVQGPCYLVRYADDFLCMVQKVEDARYERENAQRQHRKAHTFDFLGFTHFCGKSRRGQFIVGRRTSRNKFRHKCRELNAWLKAVRNAGKTKDWWPRLATKLRGHYQYYGVSGNMASLRRYYTVGLRLTLKWLNRRSQRTAFYWKGFMEYLKRYPLPQPRIMCNLYMLSPVTGA